MLPLPTRVLLMKEAVSNIADALASLAIRGLLFYFCTSFEYVLRVINAIPKKACSSLYNALGILPKCCIGQTVLPRRNYHLKSPTCIFFITVKFHLTRHMRGFTIQWGFHNSLKAENKFDSNQTPYIPKVSRS